MATAALLAVSITAQAAAPPSASRLLVAAIRDAEARGSVHESEVIRLRADVVTYRDDVERVSGRQVSTSSTGLTTEVLVVNNSVFFDGNQAALRSLYGFSTTTAQKVGTGWVSVPKSDPSYSLDMGDVTLPSALEQVTPVGHLTETAPTTVHGTHVVGIHGRAPTDSGGGTLTLYVSRSTRPLPVAAIYINASGGTRAIFSHWSKRLVLRAPQHSISLNKLTK